MPPTIGIVGGGMLGLTLAYRLAQRGLPVTVFESASELGGLASPWRLGNLWWDRHYHVILASDRALRDLLEEIGVADQLNWAATQTGFFIQGQIHPFTSPADFARFPGLNGLEKIRLLLTILLTAQRKNAAALERVCVSRYLCRLSGTQVFERFWLPLLRSKLGDNYREVSASFIWATICRLTSARRAGIQEQFGYVPGGYRTILRELSVCLQRSGVSIRLDSPVSEVRSMSAGLGVRVRGDLAGNFDQIIVTTPSAIAVQQCPQLTATEQRGWSAIRYQGIVCASLLTKKPLSSYYLTNICDEAVPFTGVVEMSALMKSEDFGGKSLVYLPKYLAPDDPFFDSSDDEVRSTFVAGLRRMYPQFQDSAIESFQVSRVRYVFALPTLDYSATLPSMETSVPGLSIVNSAHIVNGTLNVNEVVQLANRVSARVGQS